MHTGYGFCVNDFYLDITPEKIKKLLDMPEHRKLNGKIQSYFKEQEIEKPTLSDYEDFAQQEIEPFERTVGSIILCAMEEEIKAPISLYRNFSDDKDYILYEPVFSWDIKAFELELFYSKEDCKEFFEKYVRKFSDKEIQIKNYDVYSETDFL